MPTGTRPAPPTGVCQVVYKGKLNNSPWVNVFWVSITGALTYATIATFATDMYGAFQTNLLPQMSTGSSLLECVCTYYDGAGNPQGSASASHNGAVAGNISPASTAAVLSWKIPASWRGGKPRTYLGGIADGSLGDERFLTTAFSAALLTAAAAFRTTVNAITLTGVTRVGLGSVSFVHAKAWRSPPVMFEFVAVGVQQRICTQRRRLGREIF